MADGKKLLCLYCGKHFKLFDERHLNAACTGATMQSKQVIGGPTREKQTVLLNALVREGPDSEALALAPTIRSRMGGDGEVLSLEEIAMLWREYSTDMFCSGCMSVEHPSTMENFTGWLAATLIRERHKHVAQRDALAPANWCPECQVWRRSPPLDAKSHNAAFGHHSVTDVTVTVEAPKGHAQ